jgi:hypothetical protein
VNKNNTLGKNPAIVNSKPDIMNTQSGNRTKVFTMGPDLVFTMNRNRCSRWIGMSVHDGPENAVYGTDRTATVDHPAMMFGKLVSG